MRRPAASAGLLAALGAAGFVAWRSAAPVTPIAPDPDAASAVARTDGPRPLGGVGPAGDIQGGEVVAHPADQADAATRRTEGESSSDFGRWVKDTREDHTFHHCVNGRDVPEDIRASTNMTAAEAKVVANVLRDENVRVADALREFTKSLKDFLPTPEEVTAGDAYRLFQMVTAHQGLYLEMAPFFQNMDDDTQRRFYEERRPWTEFFDTDSTVIRLCKAVHAVRAASYQQMRDGGVDTDTLDRLRARYLLPGHFRYPGNNRFEFGPQLSSSKPK